MLLLLLLLVVVSAVGDELTEDAVELELLELVALVTPGEEAEIVDAAPVPPDWAATAGVAAPTTDAGEAKASVYACAGVGFCVFAAEFTATTVFWSTEEALTSVRVPAGDGTMVLSMAAADMMGGWQTRCTSSVSPAR